MTVWTIDAEPGAGGHAIARELAHRAGVPLVDEQFTLALALDLSMSVEAAARNGCSSTAEARRRLIRAERDRLRANRWLLRRRGPETPVHVACDASRLAPEAIVELLLAAAGREAVSEEPLVRERVFDR